MVETVGEAWQFGWRALMRCLHREPRTEKSCDFRLELDMDTLLVSKGPSFPLDQLPERLICPRCRSRRVAVAYSPPSLAQTQAATRPERIRRLPPLIEQLEPPKELRYAIKEIMMPGRPPVVIATAESLSVATAAYEQAKAELHGPKVILLREGKVMRNSEEERVQALCDRPGSKHS
ncbi:MAG TPA: hypothetical protein VGN97_22525 [Mesorhizobium sp.]|jgi:hypothetical protein|nr:hypothetical protein [Mesorhizobium sp.]